MEQPNLKRLSDDVVQILSWGQFMKKTVGGNERGFICRNWQTWVWEDTWRNWHTWSVESRRAGGACPHSRYSRCSWRAWSCWGSPAVRTQTSRRTHEYLTEGSPTCSCSLSAQRSEVCRKSHRGSGICWCPCSCTLVLHRQIVIHVRHLMVNFLRARMMAFFL